MGIGIIICIVASLSGLLATVTSKAFASDERVSDTNSLFFFTNVIMIALSLIFVFIFKKAGKANEASDKLKLWQYGMIFLTTLASNIASLLQVLILETGNVSMYAPLSGALSLMAAQTVSVLYREKIKPLPLLLAISAVILGIFE
jgi:drug/metabolite transporter (DMT)-like permease